MCDVLVLSAMSLSTGGFKSTDDYSDYGVGQNLPSDSSITNEPEDRIKKLEAILSATSNALVLVSRDLIEKDRKLHLSTVAVDSLTKDLAAAVGKYDQATNDVNGLTGQVSGQGQRIRNLESLLGATSNKLVLVSRDLIEKDRKLHLSTVAVESLTKDLTVAVGKYDQATNDVNGLIGQVSGQGQRIRDLECLLGATSNKLVLASHDLVVKSNALSQSVVAIADLSNEFAIVAGHYISATGTIGVVSNRLANAEVKNLNLELLLSATSNELVLASRDLLNLSNALHTSAISIETLSNNCMAVSRGYDQATNELSFVRWQLDDEIGKGYAKRKSLIETCKYGLFIKLKNAKKGEIYYSPLIRIGTNLMVMAYMPRRDVASLEQVQVMSMNYNRIGTVDSVWGLSGLYDQDIILFKLNVSNKMPALSLGVSKGGLRDHYYWFRARESDVTQAGIMSADAESSWKEYKQIVAGDMLISERCVKSEL